MTWLAWEWLWGLAPLALAIWQQRRRRKVVTLLVVAGLIVLALARPASVMPASGGMHLARHLIIALDVSYSMRARDIAPDRLTFAMRTIDTLLKESVRDEVMLVAFTTQPLLLAPMTHDHMMVQTALHSLKTENILTKGTSLLALMDLLARAGNAQTTAIILSDGGEERKLAPLMALRRKMGGEVVLVPVATSHGATLPKGEGKLRNRRGNLVITRTNRLLYRWAAHDEGVRIVQPGVTPEATAHAIAAALDAPTLSRTTTRLAHREYGPYLVALALLVFAALYWRPALIMTLMGGSNLHAGPSDWWQLARSYRLYETGNYDDAIAHADTTTLEGAYVQASAYYRLGDYAKALEAFRAIRTTHIPLAAALAYNRGNCLMKLGRFRKAYEAYMAAATLMPHDQDMLANLALARRLLASTRQGRLLPRPHAKEGGTGATGKQGNRQEDRKKHTSSSAEGGGGSMHTAKKSRHAAPKRSARQPHRSDTIPLGSRAYDIINKGYIHETTPW